MDICLAEDLIHRLAWEILAADPVATGIPQAVREQGGCIRAGESRLGLSTRAGNGLSASGVKPVCSFQQVFRYAYLFGAYSPITDDHLELELPHCSAATFRIFLDHFAAERPTELRILQRDNGVFHKARCLRWPDIVRTLFRPPYSPEPNPAEVVGRFRTGGDQYISERHHEKDLPQA